jgi:lipopolysaccharide biosynthesis glycosyltransferase
MSSLVFTLCSNNYLAQAKTLGDSIAEHNPDLRFIIGLVDRRDPEINYDLFSPFELISFDQLGFPVIDDMLAKYNIIEFNTSVKPFYIEYLFDRFQEVNKLYYIDPDIYFYESLDELDGLLEKHDIVLTPHLTVAPATVTTDELVAMRHGHFNLGFLGLRRSGNSVEFVTWWQERLKNHCVIDKGRGLFVDQKWVNLAPLYFNGIYNFKHQGYNMAWWNTSERELLESEGKYFVNTKDQQLVFFHFSGYKPGSTTHFGRVGNDEYSFDSRPDLRKLFDSYAAHLMSNDYEKFWRTKPLLDFGDSTTVKRRSMSSLVRSGLKRLMRR